jgi:hypothetical protein
MTLNFNFLRRPLALEIALTFASFLFLIPKPYLTIPALDASWQVTLEEAFFKSWKFGTTVNFTGGPLSFLYTPTSLGYYVFWQIAAESLVISLALFLIFRALRAQAFWIKAIVFICIIPSTSLGKDGIFLTSILAASLILLNTQDSKGIVKGIPTYLAVLSLMKFSFATLGIACVAILAVAAYIQKDYSRIYKTAGSYFGSFIVIWILIGQNLLTIPMFFRNSLEISKGYLWNMNLHENATTFYFLVSYLLLTSVPILIYCLWKRREVANWITLILAAASIYLCWKAGITRTGSHMGFFLQSTVLIVLLLFSIAKPKSLGNIWMCLVALSYFGGLIWIYPGGIKPIASMSWKVFTGNLTFLANPDSLNQSYTRMIPLVLLENELPEIKKQVEESSIDLLHFQHSVLLLNGLNFQPRPTIQNYHAFNSYLSKLNQTHIRDNPPDFILVRYGLVDQRYPYSDDALYNLEVFQNYKPSIVEKGYTLLQRTNAPEKLEVGPVLIEKTIQSGEYVDVAEFSQKLLWLKVHYNPSFLHKLSAFFYKPEILVIGVNLEDGTDRNFRLVGGNLEDGFLLNPLLEGDKALSDFLNSHTPITKIKSFTVASMQGNSFFPTKSFALELCEIKK